MRFLKLKYILTFAIVIALGVTSLLYFVGGLNKFALDNLNIEFSYEGYLDYSEYDADGNRYVIYDSLVEMNEAVAGLEAGSYELVSEVAPFIAKFILSSAKIVAQNTTYTMYLDEKTTIITVGVNSTATPTTVKTKEGFIKYDINSFGTKFDSAIKDDKTAQARSNILLKYIGSNDKVANIPFNTITNSASYEDKLTGTEQRHYKIKFDVENGIEILYELGEFTVIDSFFPKEFDRDDFFEYFRGNLVFIPNIDGITARNRLEYSSGFTFSHECAAYIEENNLATVTPIFSGTSILDEEGNKLPTRYDLSNVVELDENGNPTNVLKMKLGEHYNVPDVNAEGASPCVANPFANGNILDSIFNGYYSLRAKEEVTVDGKTETVTYSTDWRYTTANLSPVFEKKASGTTQFTKMFEYMYKLDTDKDPNYFYYKAQNITINQNNYSTYAANYPGIVIGDKITVKTPILYFEDLTVVKNGYYGTDRKFYEDKNLTTLITEMDSYEYFVDLNSNKAFVYEEGNYVEVNKRISIGGYHARDEEGNFLYNEDGSPVQEVLDVERANLQNDKFGNEVESTPPIFQVAVRFTLSNEGLEATILNDSILEGLGKKHREDGLRTKFSHDSRIHTIDVLPFMTSNSSETSKGQIILPDGSGAIMSFNSPKSALGYTAYSKTIYGPDMSFTFRDTQETLSNQQMMFGMFGFLDQTERKGVLAIADRGANLTSIYANFKRATATSKNTAYFTALLRENETVYVGTAQTAFNKWSRERSHTDFKYLYHFMLPHEFIDNSGNIQYVTLAQKYRNYLIDKYDLYPKDMTDSNVLALTFLGSFEKRIVTLGVAHNVKYSLTTFDQAQIIVEELMNEGALELAVAYRSWTTDAMEPQATNKAKVSRQLGGKSDMIELAKFLEKNYIAFYPEVRVTTNKGYAYNFGNLKYTAKTVGSTYSQHREYNLATGRASDTIKPNTVLSPVYYVDYVTKYLKSYNKLTIKGAFLTDLGNQKVGDYSRTRVTYPELGMEHQIAALEKLSGSLQSTMISAPFDYAFKYVDFAVDVPLESSLLGYYDYTIPFYQLVISGLFDYAGPAVNYDSSRNSDWYLLKALETGSNLQFLLSYEDTKILLETDYTMFYNTYYTNIKNDIIRLNDIINQVGIHNEAFLTSHRILKDDVYEVEYSNGLKIIINYTNVYYNDDARGINVRPNWFLVIEEAR